MEREQEKAMFAGVDTRKGVTYARPTREDIGIISGERANELVDGLITDNYTNLDQAKRTAVERGWDYIIRVDHDTDGKYHGMPDEDDVKMDDEHFLPGTVEHFEVRVAQESEPWARDVEVIRNGKVMSKKVKIISNKKTSHVFLLEGGEATKAVAKPITDDWSDLSDAITVSIDRGWNKVMKVDDHYEVRVVSSLGEKTIVADNLEDESTKYTVFVGTAKDAYKKEVDVIRSGTGIKDALEAAQGKYGKNATVVSSGIAKSIVDLYYGKRSIK